MDTACLDYCLTEDEHLEFERNGFLIVPDAFTPQMTSDVEAVVDRIDAQHRAETKMDAHEWLHKIDFVGQDEVFLELLDWHKIFPKVWGILGWNIQLYLTHIDVTPPPPSDAEQEKKRLGWHQDSGRLNAELELILDQEFRSRSATSLPIRWKQVEGISTSFREVIPRTSWNSSR